MLWLLGLVILLAVIGLTLRPRATKLSVDRLDTTNLSARYQPMCRLLDEGDFDTLNALGDRRVIRRMRSQRRTIFRAYLRCLRRDHAILCSRVRMLMVDSPIDRKDLAPALMRIELVFHWLVVAVNCRLLLHATGAGRVNVAGLLQSFDQIRGQFEYLSSAALPAPVAVQAA